MTKQKNVNLEERFNLLVEKVEALELALAPYLPSLFVRTDYGYIKKDAEENSESEQETEEQG